MMKTVLILGGTGAMGTYLVNLLDKMCGWGGGRCVVTTRKHIDNYGNVEYIQGNAQDDSFLLALLRSRRW